MKKIILLISSVVISATLVAQLPGSGVSTQSGVLDGVYIQEHIPTKRVVQYPHLREADVMWGKRVWRVIDLRSISTNFYNGYEHFMLKEIYEHD